MGGRVKPLYTDASGVTLAPSLVRSQDKTVKKEVVRYKGQLSNINDNYTLNGSGKGSFTIQTQVQAYAPYSAFFSLLGEARTIQKQIDQRNQSNAWRNTTGIDENSFSWFTHYYQLARMNEVYQLEITNHGYGQLSKIPAFIPMSFSNTVYGAMFRNRIGFRDMAIKWGFSDLLDKMMATAGTKIHTNNTIIHIQRYPDSIIISGKDKNNAAYTDTFSHMIVACPIDKIFALLNNPSRNEMLLDQAILYSPYHAVIAPLKGLPHGRYVLPKTMSRPGHLSAIEKTADNNELAVFYVPHNGPVSGKELRENTQNCYSLKEPATALATEKIIKMDTTEKTIDVIKKDLEEYGLNMGNVKKTIVWNDQFPHFNKPIYYETVAHIQGEHRTYYIGTMTHPEDTVNRVLNTTIDILKDHFSK